MKERIRAGIAQINCTVGDFDGNSAKIIDYLKNAEGMGVDIVVFPEMAITGYPPEDLLHKKDFVTANLETLALVAKQTGPTIAIVGFVDRNGKDLYNAAAILHEGTIKGIYHKILLPNYGVFDEKRYFSHGTMPLIFSAGTCIFGVNICEDIWHPNGPIAAQAKAGAKLIINLNSSPYYTRKCAERETIVTSYARKHDIAILYANLVGGQDELVFDGQSMIVDANGRIAAKGTPFAEDLVVADLDMPRENTVAQGTAHTICDTMPDKKYAPLIKRGSAPLAEIQEIYNALLLGLKDYVSKNGFKKVLIGLSGGIDSALVTTLAVDALGCDNVAAAFLPTRYSSEESRRDAEELAARLKIEFFTLPIDHIFRLYLMALENIFTGKTKDVTEENLQARIRGNMLMALSNKFGWLVLTTGNKSEMSTGYATLYGDMAGGFAVIKDVFKTTVYKLAKYRNSVSAVIPEPIIRRAPTAELRPEQKDSDTLPPYEILDKILKLYIEEDKSADDITALGFDRGTVTKTVRLVDMSEYKRRQAPPGIKITPKALGKDRRMPITNKFK